MPGNVETEFKLRATKAIEIATIDAILRESEACCGSADSSHHCDTYLDCADGRLAAAGIGLRLRQDHRGLRLTCKRKVERRGALFIREEYDAPWPEESPPESAEQLPQPLRDLVEPYALQQPLHTVLVLEIDRETRHLELDGQALCELAIDRVNTRSSAREGQFLEIEIEVHSDLASCERLADRLKQGLPVLPAGDDKPTHAAMLLGITAGEPDIVLHADTPTATAITGILRGHLHDLQHAESELRRDGAPDSVHTMRVALRRIRGLVRAFRHLWAVDDARDMLDAIAANARQLGQLRDLDVMVAELPYAIAALPAGLHEAARRVAAWMEERRTETRKQVLAWLRSRERMQSMDRLAQTLRTTSTGASESGIGDAARPHLAEAAAVVRRLAKNLPDDLPIEPLHELRIACKRLRYLAEEFQHLPDLTSPKGITGLTKLQQALGVVCDHEVAAGQLLRWIGEFPSDPAAASALGGLATRHHLAALRARKRALQRIGRAVRKKLWRAFPQAQDQTPL